MPGRSYSRSRSRSRSRDANRDRESYRESSNVGGSCRQRSRSRERSKRDREGRRIRVFVGGLPGDVRQRELDDLFYNYRPGDIKIMYPKQGNNKTYAFVDFRNFRDADDACYYRNGVRFGGSRISVEIAKGERRDKQDRKVITTSKKRTEHGVVVTGLSQCSSVVKWMDLKDFFPGATFADIITSDSDGSGIVEFADASSAKEAVSSKNNTEFKGATIGVALMRNVATQSVSKSEDTPVNDIAAEAVRAEVPPNAAEEPIDELEEGV